MRQRKWLPVLRKPLVEPWQKHILNTSTKMHSNLYNVRRKTIKRNKLTTIGQRKWLSVLREPLVEPWQQPHIKYIYLNAF